MRAIIKPTALLLLLAALSATKPCPSGPCPDTETCDATADWIAVGHVTKVHHNVAGAPMHKDFATFTFVVERWVKGGSGLPRRIPFRVGWCQNAEEMRADRGRFRFWGRNRAALPGAEWEFLHFEPAEGP